MMQKIVLLATLAFPSISALPSPQLGGGGMGGGFSFSNSGPSVSQPLFVACPPSANLEPQNGGSGPYPANYTTDATLPGHTLYLPKQMPQGLTLPILIWGEGGCQANGLQFLSLLNEIASHGHFVIASGAPGGSGQTTSAMMRKALDWAGADATRSKYPFLETARIAVAGQSCGGVEAYDLAGDARVGAVGIFNSGLMSPAASQRAAPSIRTPIFYFLGGSSDVAYANGQRDYGLLPAGTPAWKGNLPVGHSGTYKKDNAGEFGVAAVRFFTWLLRGDEKSAEFFTGDGAKAAGWSVEKKSLDAIKVTPL
jgi:hypothetical protein